jgi:hypothetical protein
MGLLHGKYATPHVGVWIMVVVSALIGSIGVLGGTVTLTGVTLASNLGTFILYGLICGITIVAFAGRPEFNIFKHGVIPVLGLIVNIIMLLAIFIIGITSGGTTAQSTYLALGISAFWLIDSVIYFIISSRRQGKAIIPSTNAMGNR